MTRLAPASCYVIGETPRVDRVDAILHGLNNRGLAGLAAPNVAPKPYFERYARDVVDYRQDWTWWLRPGDSIASSTWTCDVGLTIRDGGFTDTAATVWVTGGGVPDGRVYRATNSIITEAGRRADSSLKFVILPDPFIPSVGAELGGCGGLRSRAVPVVPPCWWWRYE